MHFRGIPVHVPATDAVPASTAWSALCDREHATPQITTKPWEVTCPSCRTILRLPAIEIEDESEKRHP